jgi:DNA-binding response OmpR family regulator
MAVTLDGLRPAVPATLGVARPALDRRTALAILDTDSGFVRVLAARAGRRGLQHRVFATLPEPDALREPRLSALIVDPSSVDREPVELVTELAAALPELAILICSAGSLAQRVAALRAGADGWLAKPCHPEEALASVEAAVRARRRPLAATDPAAEPVTAGPLDIRPQLYEGYVHERPLGLTRREFELLHLLIREKGRVLEREQIYTVVWGYPMPHGDRSIDVYVRKLRRKLAAASPD